MENNKMTAVEWLRHQFLVEVVEPTQEIFDRALQMERDEASRLKSKEILGDRKIVELEHKLTVSRADIELYKKSISDFALAISKLNNAKSSDVLEKIVIDFFYKLMKF